MMDVRDINRHNYHTIISGIAHVFATNQTVVCLFVFLISVLELCPLAGFIVCVGCPLWLYMCLLDLCTLLVT